MPTYLYLSMGLCCNHVQWNSNFALLNLIFAFIANYFPLWMMVAVNHYIVAHVIQC